MAFFCDSFMRYAVGDVLMRYNAIDGLAPQAVLPAGGRNGRGAVRLNTGGLLKTFTSADATWIGGAAVQFDALATFALYRFTDAGTSQVEIQLRPDGTLRAVRGGSTVLATSSYALSTGTWYWIEAKVVVDNSVGSVVVRVNGATRINATGLDTQNTANPTANGFAINSGSSVNTLFGDLIFRNGADAASFYDDSIVEADSPDEDGFYSDWTPSVGTDHYAVVDETAPNTADFLAATTPGNRDSFLFPDIAVPVGTIRAIQLTVAAEKDDGTTREIELFARESGTDYDSGVTEALNVTNTYYSFPWLTNPSTGLAWTEAEANAFEAGMELVT
jgi:hypothetical protein